MSTKTKTIYGHVFKCKYTNVFVWLSLAILVYFVEKSIAHGRLEEPAARNCAWRFGYKTPENYNDNELNCGGVGQQWTTNGGKCGICGDPFHGIRNHEAGGKYATGTIVRTYSSGQIIDITVRLSANHLGTMEFRLCPVDQKYVEASQECLDQNILQIIGHGTGYPVKSHENLINLKIKLPDGVTCSQCVLQWKYRAGNNWGSLPNGRSGLGVGPQEEFYNCADIAINTNTIDDPNSFYEIFTVPPATLTSTKVITFKPKKTTATITQNTATTTTSTTTTSTISTSTQTSTTTTTTTSGKSEEDVLKDDEETTTSTTTSEESFQEETTLFSQETTSSNSVQTELSEVITLDPQPIETIVIDSLDADEETTYQQSEQQEEEEQQQDEPNEETDEQDIDAITPPPSLSSQLPESHDESEAQIEIEQAEEIAETPIPIPVISQLLQLLLTNNNPSIGESDSPSGSSSQSSSSFFHCEKLPLSLVPFIETTPDPNEYKGIPLCLLIGDSDTTCKDCYERCITPLKECPRKYCYCKWYV